MRSPRRVIAVVEVSISRRSFSVCAKCFLRLSTRSSRRFTSPRIKPTIFWISPACSRMRTSFRTARTVLRVAIMVVGDTIHTRAR